MYSNGINVNTQKFYEFPSIRSLANYTEKNNVDTVSSYTNYNKLLNINDFKQKNDCPNLDYNNILLFGVTGFLGIIAINYSPDGISFSSGDIIIILASVCTVISSILSKKSVENNSPYWITGISQLSGGIILLIIAVILGGSIG